jgi:transcriptional regulator of acetoin/glycerol metabolism
VSGVARDALQRLFSHPWPGNVRELRNAVESAVVTASGDRLALLDLPPEFRSGARRQHEGPTNAGHEAQRQRIADVLREAGGNRSAAARRLGISRVALWKRMRRLGLGGRRTE